MLGLGKQYLALMFHLSQATSTFHQNLKTARLWNLGIALPFPHNWAPIRLFENARVPTILENRKSTLNAEVCIIQCFPHNAPLISFCKVLTQNKWKWQWLFLYLHVIYTSCCSDPGVFNYNGLNTTLYLYKLVLNRTHPTSTFNRHWFKTTYGQQPSPLECIACSYIFQLLAHFCYRPEEQQLII